MLLLVPGAVQRHVAYGSTKMEYGAAEALCAFFALVGCVSLAIPRGGLLVVPEPVDLVAFARLRPKLTPTDPRQVTVGGLGDAALWAEASLRRNDMGRRGVGRLTATLFRSTPWASQQKSRVDALRPAAADEAVLRQYETLVRALPPRIVPVAAKKTEPASSFMAPSVFRAFVADNLASGRRWHHGFGVARDPLDRDRFLHLFRTADNLGALSQAEQHGVRLMIEYLSEPERLLVQSVQSALRKRLGNIAGENEENSTALKKRWQRERERWRLGFAGAKTRDQLRFSLADLFSRAGTVPELRDDEGWAKVMGLVQRDWASARDLALVALAAYGRRNPTDPTDPTDPDPET
ncbi:MAG: type I-MYXAN CRISPR-associated Cas8a1/Cmx1 [Myxococcota bacterium]